MQCVLSSVALYVPSRALHSTYQCCEWQVLTMQQAQGPNTKQAVTRAPEADNSLGIMPGLSAKPLDTKQVLLKTLVQICMNLPRASLRCSHAPLYAYIQYRIYKMNLPYCTTMQTCLQLHHTHNSAGLTGLCNVVQVYTGLDKLADDKENMSN